MTVAYINGEYMPLEECRISPMDRGYLFGDGIYEVIPVYDGQLVALPYHIERLRNGLAEIKLPIPWSDEQLSTILTTLVGENGGGFQGLYLQISRGAYPRRQHAMPAEVQPTLFAYTFKIAPPSDGNPATTSVYKVITGEDMRWNRRHIKTVALLGNVMHMQEALDAGADEILLFTQAGLLTEAAACNVFVVHHGVIKTPPLNNEKLAGITRKMLLSILRQHSGLPVEETNISRADLEEASEVWLTSSTKEIGPVVTIDGASVGDGKPGPVWHTAQTLFHIHRLDF